MPDQKNDPDSAENRIIDAAATELKNRLKEQSQGFLSLTFQFHEETKRIRCLQDEHARISADFGTEEQIYDHAKELVLNAAKKLGGMTISTPAEEFDRMTMAVEKKVADELHLDHI